MTDQQALQLAAEHHGAGRLAEAEAIYRQLFVRYPGSADLIHEIGVLAFRSGRAAEGRQWIEQAVVADPARADYRNNLGLVLHELGEFDRAAAVFQSALQLAPDLAIVHYNLGNTLLAQNRWAEAEACYRRMLEQQPDHANSHLNLGLSFMRRGKLDEAIAIYRAAIQRLPQISQLWNNLGNALKQQSDFPGAMEAYRTALQHNPNSAFTCNNLGEVLKEQGKFAEAEQCFRRSLELDPKLTVAQSNLIFLQHLRPDSTSALIATEARQWWLNQGLPLWNRHRAYPNDRNPERRLRLGYVSPDFRNHPVGRHLLPLLRAHDPERFEVVAYSDALPTDDFTAKTQAVCALWRDATTWNDEQLAARILEDRIDILVDLALHTAGNRLLVFARKPAPVQVSFAGYPSTTGLETIDYRLTDRFLDPKDRPMAHYAEESIRLPGSFWLFEPIEGTPPVNAPPSAEGGGVVFGCMNKFAKMNGEVFALWSRVLLAVPNSRLLLMCPGGSVPSEIRAQFESLGVSGERLIFETRMSPQEYLALHHRVDVILDTFPYNGHTTLLDALWMGVPVVSLAGETAVSRGGLSILANLGLPELAASHADDFVRIATELVGAPQRLSELRAGLRARLQASPLMDARGYARGVEDAYRSMWRRWSDGTNSLPFSATPL